MSNFLNNLAARTTGQMEGIAPRFSTMYEPVRPMTVPDFGLGFATKASAPGFFPQSGTLTEEAVEVEARPAFPAPPKFVSGSSPKPQNNSPVESPSELNRAADLASVEGNNRRLPATPIFTPPVEIAPVLSVRPVTPGETKPDNTGKQLDEMKRLLEQLKQRQPYPVTAQAPSLAVTQPRSVEVERVIENGRELERVNPTLEPALHEVVVERAARSEGLNQTANNTPPIVARQDKSTPYRPPVIRPHISLPQIQPGVEKFKATQIEVSAAPETTQVVQVTIGRIEIKATPPPASNRPQPERSKPPVMSLDEYMRQRSKGGQR